MKHFKLILNYREKNLELIKGCVTQDAPTCCDAVQDNPNFCVDYSDPNHGNSGNPSLPLDQECGYPNDTDGSCSTNESCNCDGEGDSCYYEGGNCLDLCSIDTPEDIPEEPTCQTNDY